MKLVHRRLITALGGALWIMLATGSAHAEDVELFVGDVGIDRKPNILLILDDSGSMDSDVESQIDYDPTVSYDGTCDSSRVYWQETRRWGTDPPDSDDCSTTDRWINKSALVCKQALDALASADGGTYTDTFAQYHPATWWGGERWGDIASDLNDRLVECEDDWGRHGDGSSSTEVYPRHGDETDLFTGVENDGINWGGWRGVGDNYTLYDGNYLNWINGPGQPSTRLEIMQEVAVNLVTSVSGVNMGLMSFNNSQGGRVRRAIGDLETERSSLVSEINSLNAENWTPLSETLYEAHQYFRGANVVYGSAGDPDAFDTSDSDRYQTPMEYTCQKNHVVLLTDGEPTEDWDANSAIESLTDSQSRSFSELTGNSSCDTEDYPSELSPDGGRCLDDLAGYMNKADLSGSLEDEQNVTTHTVGFFTDLPVLDQAASRGGGEYYTADDTASLKSALTAIITDILETQSTFVAPAVSINAYNQTRNLSDLYFSVFQPSGNAHWPGNLKKYKLRASDGAIVDADGELAVDEESGFFAGSARSFWSPTEDGPNVEAGGAANLIPNPRSVYTHFGGTEDLTAAGNAISTDNASLTDDVLGTGSDATPSKEEVIAFMNGLDAPDVDRDGITDEPRNQMGDPLHARPATVIYGPDNSDGIIYFATNDGYLHAIDTDTGVEQWAFLPEEFLSQQVNLFSNNSIDDKLYGIDGSMAVQYQADRDNTIESDEKVYLFFGMRRGGQFYYGLDVSDPANPEVLWQLDDSDLLGMGESWATPTPARINIAGVDQNEDNMVLIIAGGYDPSQDGYTASTDGAGNSIYIVDSESGDLLWHGSKENADANFAEGTGANATMDFSMPAPVKAVDINSDGYTDRIYAGDMGGQVWRFDVFNGESVSDLVTGGVIAQLGAAGTEDPTLAETRRFYNAPDTAFVSSDEQTFLHIGIGSGYRAHPNDESTRDRFYAIRDYDAFTWRGQDEWNSIDPDVDSDFVDVTDDIDADVPDGSAGWKYELRDGGWRGEKVLAEAMTFDGEVFFNTFRPGVTGDGCNPSLGVTRQYRVSLFNGAPVTHIDEEVDEDGDGETDPLTEEDRYTEEDGSILSRTTVIFVDESGGPDDGGDGGDDDEEGIVVGCTETDCSDLDFDTSPRRTFWTQDNVE